MVSEPVQPATALNPAAGRHLVTADPVALAASAAAIARTYAEFPYYQERFGDRGRAFSSSDSGWMITVADDNDESCRDQLAWLGRVLGNRGMPRLLLATHLEHLARELEQLAPTDERTAPRARRFRDAAAAISRGMTDRIPEADRDRIVAEFDRCAPEHLRERLPRTGDLAVAAVADERAGLPQAVASLLDWIADPRRFPDDWVRAVEQAVAAARGVSVPD